MENKTLEVIPVNAPPMGKFNAELEVIKTIGNQKLIKTYLNTFKELTRKEGEEFFEVTNEFRRVPEKWKIN